MNLDRYTRIGIIGLGYVGLPLAVEFAKKFKVRGFDINLARVSELIDQVDKSLEITSDQLAEVNHNLSYHSNENEMRDCDIYIVTVPTPINANKQPDLRPLVSASTIVGGIISKGNMVVYESTVYPGVTEMECLPIIERVSGLTLNADFILGYSPERINPGDKQRPLSEIVKIVSSSSDEGLNRIVALYESIISAGVYIAPSIKVAEAAKVVENTQRDINIALVNELAMIFNRLDIETLDVLEAAGSKWNFLPFRPGLVGGHCIGVDPYYLTHKAQAENYHPELILAGRRINDTMPSYLVNFLTRLMVSRKMPLQNVKILVAGLTFKENCPDIRNSRVIDILDELKSLGLAVDVHDPWVDAEQSEREYGVRPIEPRPGQYDVVIVAVGHDCFRQEEARMRALGKPNALFFDIKGVFPKHDGDIRL